MHIVQDEHPNNWPWWKMLLLLIAFLVLTALALTSCELTKHFKKNQSDTTGVSKSSASVRDSINETSVKKETSNIKEAFDWYKVTQQFAPRKDSNVTNVYNYPAQPATIIYEGGKGSKETNSSSIDSGALFRLIQLQQNKMDSLSAQVKQSQADTHTETKGVGLITVILIVGAGFVLNQTFGFIKSKYSIVKK